MISYSYLEVSWSPRNFVYNYTMNPCSEQTLSLEERQPSQEPRPCQEEDQNADQPQGRSSTFMCKLFNHPSFSRMMFIGIFLLFWVLWIVIVALLIYHKKYAVVTFVFLLFLTTLATVFFRMFIATWNANSNHTQIQGRNSLNPPPSYETVVASPPDYNQLYDTTTSNETAAQSTLDPEDTAANNDSNSSDIVGQQSIECSKATCEFCQELDGEDPPSYEEAVIST